MANSGFCKTNTLKKALKVWWEKLKKVTFFKKKKTNSGNKCIIEYVYSIIKEDLLLKDLLKNIIVINGGGHK